MKQGVIWLIDRFGWLVGRHLPGLSHTCLLVAKYIWSVI